MEVKNGCLPLNRKYQLANSFSKWDASKPRRKISVRCANSISTDISPERTGTSRNGQMERAQSVWKFHLGILAYLSRNPIFAGNFPFSETKPALPFTNFRILGINGKQPMFQNCGSVVVCASCAWSGHLL